MNDSIFYLGEDPLLFLNQKEFAAPSHIDLGTDFGGAVMYDTATLPMNTTSTYDTTTSFASTSNNNYTTDLYDMLSYSSSSSPVLPQTPHDEIANPYLQMHHPQMSNTSNQSFEFESSSSIMLPPSPKESPSASPTSPRKSSTSSTSTSSTSSTANRKQSESRISLPELYARMGLKHDHAEARTREQRVLGILRQQGFKLGERTWIRDTSQAERRRIIDEIYDQTHLEYQYSKQLIEVIIRRGTYYLMQGRLRRQRRAHVSIQRKEALRREAEQRQQEAMLIATSY